MATTSTDSDRLDLVPMIDCIMLLLLFFMMTTKFSSADKSIAALLPTTQGPSGIPTKPLDPPTNISVSLYPAGITRGYQPTQYAQQMAALHRPGEIIPDACLRIGNGEPLLIPGILLSRKGSAQSDIKIAATTALIEQIHAFIASELSRFEKLGEPRNKQDDILIHCFSGLSWKFALIAYDGVRDYEGVTSKIVATGNPDQLQEARAVTFVPPRIRDHTGNELGDELFEIINQ